MCIKMLRLWGIGLALVFSGVLTARDICVYNLSELPLTASVLYTDKGKFYPLSGALVYTIEGHSYQNITIPPHIPAVEATKNSPFKAAIAWTLIVAPATSGSDKISWIRNFVNGGKLEFGAMVGVGTEEREYCVLYAVVGTKITGPHRLVFAGETKMIIEVDKPLEILKQRYKHLAAELPKTFNKELEIDQPLKELKEFKQNPPDKFEVIKQVEQKTQAEASAETKRSRSSTVTDRAPLAQITPGQKDQKPAKPATIKQLGT